MVVPMPSYFEKRDVEGRTSKSYQSKGSVLGCTREKRRLPTEIEGGRIMRKHQIDENEKNEIYGV
jgi:hypothetical protein